MVACPQTRRAEIIAHNKDPTKSWKRTINRFADQTDEERAQVRGGGLYHGPRMSGRREHVPPTYSRKELPETVDWRESELLGALAGAGAAGLCSDVLLLLLLRCQRVSSPT